MSNKPFTVAVVGRPNVGKSAIFNRFLRKRKAIVDDREGITRDRLCAEVDVFGKEVAFIDTGGITSDDSIEFSKEIREQTLLAVEEADLLLMITDVSVGITLHDEEVAKILLKQNKPVVLAVNKVDNQDRQIEASPFYALGIEELFPVSALHGAGIGDLLEWISNKATVNEKIEEDKKPQVAILGRPNVGKSTLFNQILDEQRTVVSDVAGTTRDAIDVDAHGLTFIDTAGVKRKSSEKEVVEKFASIRTQETLKRADVAICVIDATDGLTTQEKRLLTEIEESGKGCIIFINKWDLIKGAEMEKVINTIRLYSPFLKHIPILIGSAKTGRNVEKLLPLIRDVYQNFTHRITTGELNTILERAMQAYYPPMVGTRRLRIYYMTQVKSGPPQFCLFVNDAKIFPKSYKRYLHNVLRKAYPLEGVPLHFSLKGRKKAKAK